MPIRFDRSDSEFLGPRVAGMYQFEARAKPRNLLRTEQWDNSVKVHLILIARTLRLEQQYEFRCHIGDRFFRMTNQLRVRQSNPLISATYPLRAVVRIPEYVEVIGTSLGVAEPGLKCGVKNVTRKWPTPTGVDYFKVVVAEGGAYL